MTKFKRLYFKIVVCFYNVINYYTSYHISFKGKLKSQDDVLGLLVQNKNSWLAKIYSIRKYSKLLDVTHT